jgi:hypothetical protein
MLAGFTYLGSSYFAKPKSSPSTQNIFDFEGAENKSD